jgi:phosphatidylglycerophosphate synthase
MVDKLLREPKETLLRPLLNRTILQINPTHITVLAMLVGVAAGIAAWQQSFLLAIGLWLLNRVLDGLDGSIARMTERQSDLGAYLDIVLDHVTYIAIPLGIAMADGSSAGFLALALLLASFYVNGATWMYLAALLEKRQAGAQATGELTSVTMPSGLIEGAETIGFYLLFLIFPQLLVPLFAVMAVLVVITAGQRIIWATKHLH